MKQQRQKTTIKLMILLLLAAILILPACMETTSPSNENERELTVLVYRTSVGTTNGSAPVRGAEVNIFFADNANLNPLQAYTNSQGAAVFRFKVPITGQNYNVSATYNNRTQSKNSVLICKDTTLIFNFDTTNIASVSCNDLSRDENLVFTDDLGNPELKLNTPANINRYEKCSAGLYNSGKQDITLTLPKVNPPFKLLSVLIDGLPAQVQNNKVVIKPGQTLTLCFSVSTKETGNFTQELVMPMVCEDGQEGVYTLTLNATVVPPTCDCDEYSNFSLITLTERVPTGQSKEIKQVVFTNNSPCDVVIGFVGFDGNDGWQILHPQFPVTIKSGQSLEITARFTPPSANEHSDTLNLEVRPIGTDNICDLDIYLEGEGCAGGCPLFSTDGFYFDNYTAAPIIDTISDRTDKRVYFSLKNATPPITTTVTRLYYFMNPDSACEDLSLNISLVYQNGDIYSPRYFDVSPESLTLAPGEVGVIQVTFISPDIEELDEIVKARGSNGITADSAFNLMLYIDSPGCRQRINATTVITVFPDISPIINLRAYSQRTRLAPDPENEVYFFGDDARTIIKGNGNGPGPFPPPRGDIWIDVNDTLPNANPPQEPILKSVSGTLGMKVWQTNMPESEFIDVGQTYLAFTGDPNYSIGYAPDPLTGLAPGNVIAFKINQFMYALIYIRSIYNGTENNTNLQSGIEFRAIYPIYIP
jgi:hypothetical protein